MKISPATILIASLIALPLFAGEIYRVVDKEGRVIFTDSPSMNDKADVLELPPINTLLAPTAPSKKENTEVLGEAAAYSSVRISQPINNAVIPPGQAGVVVVELALSPALQEGHQVQLYVNDKKHGSSIAGTTFTIGRLTRGQHRIRAEIIGADGKHQAQTQTVAVHVKQHSSKH